MKAILFFALAAAGASAFADDSIWYVVSYGGQRVGYYKVTYRPHEVSGSQKLVFKRLGKSLTMASSSSVVENDEGHVTSFRGQMSSSNSTTDNVGSVEGKTIHLKSTAAGKSYNRDVNLDEALLGTEAADELTIGSLRKQGDRVAYWTIEPVSASLIKVERICKSVSERDGLEVEEKMTSAGIDHTIWLDSKGRLIRSKDQSPFGEAIYARASEKEALAAGLGGELRSEVYGQSTAKTNIRLPDPRSIQKVVLQLTNLRPELGWPHLASETQHVLKMNSKSALVEVDQAPVTSKEDDLKQYLEPNTIIQSDDASVKALARSIVGSVKDPWIAAKKLRDWESEHMRFDAGVAVAPSSEVARDRRGTCFAYSSLLAGMCRSIGIPARFVMGFGYAERMYGGHAWVDVRIGQKWIPLDAALTEPGPADAARLRCVTSSLANGYSDIEIGGALYGSVDVRVVSYTIHGRTVAVPAGAAPYSVHGSVYRNPWLGIQESMPAGFRYRDLDRSYPDAEIFTAINGGDSVIVSQMPDGYRPDTGVTTTLKEGLTTWVFEAHGKHAQRTLRQALAGWKHLTP